MRAHSKLIDIGSDVVYTTKAHRFLYLRNKTTYFQKNFWSSILPYSKVFERKLTRNTLNVYSWEDTPLKKPYDIKLKAAHNKGRNKTFYLKRAIANNVGFNYD